MSRRNFIRLRGELAEGRKVFRVADALYCDRDKALGVMCRWLLWVDANCESADTGLDWGQVDELLGCEGVFRALEAIGWVELREGTVRVLEFEKHLSPTAKERQLTAARVAACKARKRAAAAGVEVSAGLKAKGSGTRLRKSGQAASATPRRVACRLREATPRQAETTSTRKGAKQ